MSLVRSGILALAALASGLPLQAEERRIVDLSWVDLVVIAAAGGASDNAFERNLDLAGTGDGFAERDVRRALIQSFRDEAQRRTQADPAWLSDLAASAMTISVDVPVPEFDFGRMTFQFCIASSVDFLPPRSAQKVEVEADDIQLAIDFRGEDSGLWAFIASLGGGCDQPGARDRYAALPGTDHKINVSASVPVHFKDEADAERVYRAMQASPDGLIETRVICGDLQNPSESQVFPRCWVTAIEIGRNPDGSPWFRYDYRGAKDWALTVGDSFAFVGGEPMVSVAEPAAAAAPDPAAAEATPAPQGAASEAELLTAARALHETVANGTAADRRTTLQEIRALLDLIVTEHPGSETALMIVLQMPVEGIDIAAIDAELAASPAGAAAGAGVEPVAPVAAEPVAPVAAEPVAPEPVAPAAAEAAAEDAPPPPATMSSAETEAALALDEKGWRDVQARLLVLGFDPNGIDGEVGRGTRAALTEWQAASGLPATGFLAADHLERLVAASQAGLEVWQQDEENQLLLNPPPPIELTAGRVNGTWSFKATCGKNSAFPGQTITGVMEISLGRDRSIKGTVRNSQGFNGRVSGQLSGRRMSGVINWGLLLGKVRFAGNIASQSLSFSGEDSNGCRLRAGKG